MNLNVRCHLKLLETAPFDKSHTSSYSSSAVTMALFCIISEIKQDNGRKSRFFIPLLNNNPMVKNGCHYLRYVFLHPSQLHGHQVAK